MQRSSFLLRHMVSRDDCGAAPSLDGQPLDQLIAANAGSKKALMIAIPHMRCTEASKAAIEAKGFTMDLVDFTGQFAYVKGESDPWDWLHCKYPDDQASGTIMHSYVFVDGVFRGNGFDAATVISSGSVDQFFDVSAL